MISARAGLAWVMTSDSASGKPSIASCKAKKGSSMYMLFASAADCNEERETQLANGAGE